MRCRVERLGAPCRRPALTMTSWPLSVISGCLIKLFLPYSRMSVTPLQCKLTEAEGKKPGSQTGRLARTFIFRFSLACTFFLSFLFFFSFLFFLSFFLLLLFRSSLLVLTFHFSQEDVGWGGVGEHLNFLNFAARMFGSDVS